MSGDSSSPLSIKFPKDLILLKTGGWSAWSSCVLVAFMAADLEGYIMGTVEEPTTDKKLNVFKVINKQIVGILAGVVSAPLRQRLATTKRTAAQAWKFLREETYEMGVAGKLASMNAVLKLRYAGEKDNATVAAELDEYLSVLCEDNTPPTVNELKIMLTLNCLEGTSYEWLRRDLMTQVAKDSKISIDMISSLIKMAMFDGMRHDHDNAHVMKGASKAKVKCSNCCSTRHSLKSCWAEGGGAADEAPEWWKKQRAEKLLRDKKRGKEKANAAQVSSDDGSIIEVNVAQDSARLADDYMSCPAVDVPEERWSGNWDGTNTRQAEIDIANAAQDGSPFCLDSGCTSHCTPTRADFTELKPIDPRPVKGLNGASIPAVGRGTVVLRCGEGRKLTLRDVLYVPQSTIRLVSVGRLADDGFETNFTKSRCTIKDSSGKMIADGIRTGTGLYYYAGKSSGITEHANLARALPDLATWHRRLGHISYESIIKMAKHGLAQGMPADLSTLPPLCEHCVFGKQTKTPVPKERGGGKALKKLEKVYSDITGPEDVLSNTGHKYVLNFIDDHSAMTWIYLLKRKSDAETAFKEWRALVENQSGETIRILRTDNGGEYTSGTFATYLRKEGIRHETTAPYTSAENGRSERVHRTIMNRARAIRSDSKLPPNMWGEAVRAAGYLKNRTPTRVLDNKTPFEVWFGKRPDISHLRELGCKAFVFIQGENPKIYNRSLECILVGYSESSKAYRCLHRPTGQIHVTRNVVFIESQDQVARPLHPGLSLGIDVPLVVPEVVPSLPNDQSTTPSSPTDEITMPRRSSRPQKLSAAGAAMKGVERMSDLDRIREEVRASEKRLRDAREGTAGDMMNVLDEVMCELPMNNEDPRSFKDAMSRSDAADWLASYEDEMKSLRKHDVYTLIPRDQVPPGRKVIPSKPVFSYKRNEKGEIYRHKTRVVAKGFAQRAGIDYTESFAPVARMESMRVILHIGAAKGWDIHQMDIKTAFLHGDLDEEIYMEQPEGMREKGKETWVARLNRTLYGLVQAARGWNMRLHRAMVESGYERAAIDHCVYIRTSAHGTSIVGIHVDDMCATASPGKEMAALKTDLGRSFDLVDLGPVRHLLGIGLVRDMQKRTISLSQTAYIDTIVKRLGMQDAFPVWTPLDPHVTLSASQSPTSDEEKLDMKKHPYLVAIGSLMYAAMGTRPDIAFAVQQLSRFSSNPGPTHWTAVQRIFRYLLGTREACLVLGGDQVELSGWTDSDWAANIDNRRSVSGYAFSLGGGMISWSSKRQATVALSSTEAEYMASTHACKEAMWLRSLLKLMGYPQTGRTRNTSLSRLSATTTQ